MTNPEPEPLPPDLLSTPDFYGKVPARVRDWIRKAQQEIHDLRQRVDLSERLSTSEPTEVRVGLGGYTSSKDMVDLPTGSEIEFITGPNYGETLSLRMPTTRDQGWVEVGTDGPLSTILVRPCANNALFLKAQVR